MDLNEENELTNLVSQLKGVGLGLSLSNFVKLNYSLLTEIRNLYIPLKRQSEIVEKSIGKPVSMAALSVAISRLKPKEEKDKDDENKKEQIIIMKTGLKTRFVKNEAVLTLGTQKETVKEIKNGVVKEEERVIDWRGLAPKESVSNWIVEYKDRLIAINHLGWRWKQIASAINEHLSLQKKISANTLTSVISIANKKITTNKQTN